MQVLCFLIPNMNYICLPLGGSKRVKTSIINIYSGQNKCVASVQKFQIKNKQGKKLFTASDNKVSIGAEKLHLEGKFIY